METDNKNKEKETLENKLNDFLTDNNQNNQECEGEECLINDGKEIVERVNKVYKTNDGRQLLM
jgi:predicted Rossmann fold nucleotide-binding protein DprA/Smf involved in DNA uptake